MRSIFELIFPPSLELYFDANEESFPLLRGESSTPVMLKEDKNQTSFFSILEAKSSSR